MRRWSLNIRRERRGMVMVIALFFVVITLLVAVAVLDNAAFSANDALNVQTKNQTFNAAEAGLNVAMFQLDQNNAIASGNPTPCASPLVGYTCTWEVVLNRLYRPAGRADDPNPQQPNKIIVPAGEALIAGWATSILGGRTVYVEQIVTPGPPIVLPKGAIVCGGTGTISHQQISDITGLHSADIRCGTIISSGGGQTPDGNSYASGTTNQIVGFDGTAHTQATPPKFLTAGQLAALQTSTLIKSQQGAPNFYTAGDFSTGTIGTNGSNCVAYIGGSLVLSGSSSIINYCPTTVVMGDIVISGNPTYQALPASTAHILYVFGTNGVWLNGTPTTWGIVYSANADVTIDGSGNGNFAGAVITPHNATMFGGGTGSFSYNGAQLPPPAPNPVVIPQSQWEY
jgi:hypothetical protein